MGIDGLTGEARFPRLGVLRKGDPKPNDRQPGRDLTDELRFAGVDDDVQEEWRAAFGGDKVDELTVRLPYPDVDACWQAWRETYVSGGLVCRCDGRQHVLWLDEQTGEYRTDPRPCPGRSCEAKAVGRLELLVHGLPRLGVVTLTTTSIHDIKNLDGAIRVLAMTGDLSRIPLRLTRVKRMISTPGAKRGDRRQRREKWLLHIEAEPTWVSAMIGGAASAALPSGATPALPDPDAHFSGRIAEAGTLDELRALFAEAQSIESAGHKENTLRLLWGRVVAVIAADASAASPAKLDALDRALASVPPDVDGRDDAEAFLRARRGELVEADAAAA